MRNVNHESLVMSGFLAKLDEYRSKFSESLTRKQAAEVLLDERFPKGISGGEYETFKTMLDSPRADECLMEVVETEDKKNRRDTK